ncbi:MAG: LON peptidase substrate-binding domain-containing protein [Rubrivivax sp.]|nr:LON peptidase substrate-binding domain-containing protein [Rubrivivax sp.]
MSITTPLRASLPDPLPLFPLGLVLFPGAGLGLKVFEARYLDLVSRCLREGLPFGVVCLLKGAEAGPNAKSARFERVGTLAHIEEVDAETPGILHVRCRAGARFRLVGDPAQQSDGLWQCRAESITPDIRRVPGAAMANTVAALAEAIRKLADQDQHPFPEPHALDDAGWVANRWCELLPVPLSAKQKLMELDDPVIRLSVVDGFLRDKKVVVG